MFAMIYGCYLNLIPVSSQCYDSEKSRIVLGENIIGFLFSLLLQFTHYSFLLLFTHFIHKVAPAVMFLAKILV